MIIVKDFLYVITPTPARWKTKVGGHSSGFFEEKYLSAWRVYYASHGIGLMNEQILLLKMIESGGELEGITGKPIPELTTTE